MFRKSCPFSLRELLYKNAKESLPKTTEVPDGSANHITIMLRTKFMFVLFVWQSPDKCSGYMISEDLLMTGIKPLDRGKLVKGEFIEYVYFLIYDFPLRP